MFYTIPTTFKTENFFLRLGKFIDSHFTAVNFRLIWIRNCKTFDYYVNELMKSPKLFTYFLHKTGRNIILPQSQGLIARVDCVLLYSEKYLRIFTSINIHICRFLFHKHWKIFWKSEICLCQHIYLFFIICICSSKLDISLYLQ